jgi:adenylylsulfate kinase
VENTNTRYGRGFTLWFTGLSGAGKTTISEIVEKELRARFGQVEVLDGDIVRTNLSKGLGFSKEDRDTNILRIGFVADLLTRNGVGVKGLYKKAFAGEIPQFTGVSDPYEPPAAPELHIKTSEEEPNESARRVIDRLEELGYLRPAREFNRA